MSSDLPKSGRGPLVAIVVLVAIVLVGGVAVWQAHLGPAASTATPAESGLSGPAATPTGDRTIINAMVDGLRHVDTYLQTLSSGQTTSVEVQQIRDFDTYLGIHLATISQFSPSSCMTSSYAEYRQSLTALKAYTDGIVNTLLTGASLPTSAQAQGSAMGMIEALAAVSPCP